MTNPAVGSSESSTIARGMLFMTLAVAVFSMQNALTKHLAQNYPAPFFTMIRYWAFAAFAFAFAGRRERSLRRALSVNRPFLQVLRSVLLVAEIGVFAIGLRHMGQAEMQALFLSYPLIVTALSAVLLGEVVGWRRWAAVGAGFVGVLVILRPGFDAFQPTALIAIGSAVMFALYNVMTRMAAATDSAGTTFLYTGLVGAAAVSLVGPFYWTRVAEVDVIWLAALCVTGVIGHFLMIKALEAAPASALQPCCFLGLIWAVLIGYLAFDEVPDAPTLAGGAIVVGSGLYMIYREHMRGDSSRHVAAR